MNKMNAVRLNVAESRLSVVSVPVPRPGPGEVLVKVKAAEVCLSDVHIADGSLNTSGLPPPMITLGHEVSGVVVETGPGTSAQWADSAIAVDPLDRQGPGRTLGVNFDGGWAEYVVVPEHCLVPVPEGVPFDQAAIVPDAVATPWAAIPDIGELIAGESVGIWGVGGLGTHAVMLATLVGASPIVAVDPASQARERALAAGADMVLDPTRDDIRAEIKQATEGRNLDVIVDYVARPATYEQQLQALSRGGRLVLTGMGEEPFSVASSGRLSRNRWKILGQYGIDRSHIDEIFHHLKWGRLDLSSSVSKTYPLTKGPEAIRELKENSGELVRIVLLPELS